jgi:hypothetical protein
MWGGLVRRSFRFARGRYGIEVNPVPFGGQARRGQRRVDYERLTCLSVTDKFAGLLFLFFLNIWFAHDRRPAKMLVLWEAGETPALPRNCKRGNRDRSLGCRKERSWEGRL